MSLDYHRNIYIVAWNSQNLKISYKTEYLSFESWQISQMPPNLEHSWGILISHCIIPLEYFNPYILVARSLISLFDWKTDGVIPKEKRKRQLSLSFNMIEGKKICFNIGSHYVALASLELTTETRLLQTQRSAYLLCSRIKGVSRACQLTKLYHLGSWCVGYFCKTVTKMSERTI